MLGCSVILRDRHDRMPCEFEVQYFVGTGCEKKENVYILVMSKTIRHIAQSTNLSIATVSRALRGDPSVRPSTRKRILKAADELGYQRNRAAVRLKTGKTRVIGFILNRGEPSDTFARQLLLGLTDRLLQDDYHLIVLPEPTSTDCSIGIIDVWPMDSF